MSTQRDSYGHTLWLMLLLLVAVCASAEDLQILTEQAEAGVAGAQINLGKWHSAKTNHVEAIKWFRKAAEQGDAEGQRCLGWMYSNGEGVPQDYAEAITWFRRAAEQGDAAAQNILGQMYADGVGVLKDNVEALKWFHMAAEQGAVEALYNIGQIYFNSGGVRKHYAEAAKWFAKAAEQGSADAQHNLAVMYFNGWGVPQDNVAAYAWHSVAATAGDGDAGRIRDNLKNILTPSQLEAGQAMVREILKRIVKQQNGDDGGNDDGVQVLNMKIFLEAGAIVRKSGGGRIRVRAQPVRATAQKGQWYKIRYRLRSNAGWGRLRPGYVHERHVVSENRYRQIVAQQLADRQRVAQQRQRQKRKRDEPKVISAPPWVQSDADLQGWMDVMNESTTGQ